MRNPGPIATLAVLCLVPFGGCMSSLARTYPATDLRREITPHMQDLSPAEIQAMLETPVHVRVPSRAALVWTNDRYGGVSAPVIAEATRTRLIEDLIRELDAHPFTGTFALPTHPVARAGTSPVQPHLSSLRTAAARFQADVLIVLTTHIDAYSDPNFLWPFYLAILPMLVVPGNDLAVLASAEACVLDVRTGIFIGCALGHGKGTDRFVTIMSRDDAFRELAKKALAEAVLPVPQSLRSSVERRARGAATAQPLRSGNAPIGVPYTTVGR